VRHSTTRVAYTRHELYLDEDECFEMDVYAKPLRVHQINFTLSDGTETASGIIIVGRRIKSDGHTYKNTTVHRCYGDAPDEVAALIREAMS
jgi:hypothetical protein